MKVSVIIPSARPDKLVECVEQLIKATPQGVEIITVTDDPQEIPGTINYAKRGNPVELWNYGASKASGDYFVLGADDLWFNDGWLEASVRGFDELGGHGLVGFNDLSPMAGKMATHYMISKGYACADWGGVMVIPAYKAQFIDNEATVRAVRDGRFYYAEDAIVEHRHPIWGKAEKDEIYERGDARYAYGERVFNERLKAGFPNDWEPSFTRTEPKEGWGTVAVSARVYKFPEVDFFRSWTLMLMGGLRIGDMVVLGEPGLPSHLAAGKIIREFLYSDRDSLLLIDDDMEFSPDALTTLRNNQDNWGYDVVQAFCTHKSYPPHAVVLREMADQPILPTSLAGKIYGSLRDIEDHTVIQVDAVGLAFTLIKRHVLEALINEYGATHTYDFVQWGPGTTGEDVDFSQKLRGKGFDLAVDTNTKVEHIGKASYGWKQFKHFVNGSKT